MTFPDTVRKRKERGPERADGSPRVSQLIYHWLGWARGLWLMGKAWRTDDRELMRQQRELRWLPSLL